MRYELRKYKNDVVGYEVIFSTSSIDLLFNGYHSALRKGNKRTELYLFDNMKKEVMHLWV